MSGAKVVGDNFNPAMDGLNYSTLISGKWRREQCEGGTGIPDWFLFRISANMSPFLVKAG